MGETPPLIYRIDASDQLTFLGLGWDEFAEANGAQGLDSAAVRGRRLWEFITDGEIRLIFQMLVERVRRAGEHVKVEFRCDGPAQRRFMQLEVLPTAAGELEFRSSTLRTEDRAPVQLWDADACRGPSLLRVCSWCKKVALGGHHWVEVEVAAESYGLFDGEALPQITHGICEPCAEPFLGPAHTGDAAGRTR